MMAKDNLKLQLTLTVEQVEALRVKLSKHYPEANIMTWEQLLGLAWEEALGTPPNSVELTEINRFYSKPE
jgi:hypothetical protein